MASIFLHWPIPLTVSRARCCRLPVSSPTTHFSPLQSRPIPRYSPSWFPFQDLSLQLRNPKIGAVRASANDYLETIEEEESLSVPGGNPLKLLAWVVLWASVSIGIYAFSGNAAKAAAATGGADSIRASGFGIKIANALRASGWPDGAIVFTLATLPVIELRGAIPVGYWLQLKPVMLTVLSVLGNMVPVPFIILYLKKLATFLAGKNQTASQVLNMLFERAKDKAGPVKEFRWLGLMLFVAVPFPGTGAWTGAMIASVLDMPFWSGFSANFVGVLLAGLLVNLLVNLGLKYAVVTGVILLVISTFMWNILRGLKNSVTQQQLK